MTPTIGEGLTNYLLLIEWGILVYFFFLSSFYALLLISAVLDIGPHLQKERGENRRRFEREFAAAVRDQAWFGSVGEFGQWWATRNLVDVDVQTQGSLHTITLGIPGKIERLTLQIPTGWNLKRWDPSMRVVAGKGGHVIIQEAAGKSRIVFESASPATNRS
jgi:hypothetical protein